MGQSLVKNYIHIVFSTQNHQKLIDEDIEDELYAYLGGVCKLLACQPLKVGGYMDHVHILCMLSKNLALMKLVEEVKSSPPNGSKPRATSIKNSTGKRAMELFQ
jgi:putative transposase